MKERGKESLIHTVNSIARHPITPPNPIYVPPHRRYATPPNLVYVPPNRRSTPPSDVLHNRRSTPSPSVVPHNRRSIPSPSVVPPNRRFLATDHGHPKQEVRDRGGWAIPGITEIKDGCNPATWMLEVSAASIEIQLDVDFAEVYVNSTLYWRNQELIEELSTPASGSKEVYFPTELSQSFSTQCVGCFWKFVFLVILLTL
ncbi:hypothetical protein IFM89_027383 [Coptis chinensis]|uniref:Uncharacterized protein n=1 Tax=Coptis chinensis TaxID=261450 RepID=A0A835H9B8_9MAGN|nr:hypothetical protein IFM89_027383 [Coptis chinensis]